MIGVHLSVNEERIAARFLYLPSKIKEKLRASMASAINRVEERVRQKLSGEVLNIKSGALKNSIFSFIEAGTFSITGVVRSSGSVRYANIHEYGGKTSPHIIVPVKAAALHFIYEGKEVFASLVHHPGSQIPERSYLRSTWVEMADSIKSEIKDGMRNGVKE